MNTKYELSASKAAFDQTFKDSHNQQMNSLITSILDTEGFDSFGKYNKEFVLEYFKSFLFRLTSNIWKHYADYNVDLQKFFATMTPLLIKHIGNIKRELEAQDLISEMMTDDVIRKKLNHFFMEYENKKEFLRIQKGYINIKKSFNYISDLAHCFYSTGKQMVAHSEELMEQYLKYKEAVYHGMGFDVKLEYVSADNFNFVYNDQRLNNAEERAKYEQVVMNAALKAAMPGFDGDINVFARIVANL